MKNVKSDQDIREKLPSYDCGLCGFPTCSVFARRVAVSLNQPNECLPMPDEDEKTICGILDQGVMTGVCEKEIDRDTVEINPCAEGGKVTLETQMKCGVRKDGCSRFNLLDFQYLEGYLKGMPGIENIMLSKEMGYAKFEIQGQRVHVFKRGKLIIRRADSKETAMDILRSVSRLVWPAVICPECGITLSGSAYTPDCPFTWNPTDFECKPLPKGTEPSKGFDGLPSIESYFERLKSAPEPPTDDLFAELGARLSRVEGPEEGLRLLAFSGTLEAMSRIFEVENNPVINVEKLLSKEEIFPLPNETLNWKDHKVMYNLHLASICLMSVLP